MDAEYNKQTRTAPNSTVAVEEPGPDLICVYYRGQRSDLEFTAFSIWEQEVLVRHLRDRVAQQYGLGARPTLLYKGAEMSDDGRPIQAYGCKHKSKILVNVTAEHKRHDRAGLQVDDGDHTPSAREGKPDCQAGRAYLSYATYGPHFRPLHALPRPLTRSQSSITTSATPLRSSLPRTRLSSPRPIIDPSRRPQYDAVAGAQVPVETVTTPFERIRALERDFRTRLRPRMEGFLHSPPDDEDTRAKGCLRFSEEVYNTVFEVGDRIAATGSDQGEMVRSTRRQLYEQAHAVLRQLDRVGVRSSK